MSYADLNSEQRKARLRELASVFLKLGTIAFGGPAAHVAMMDEEVVQRRQWMSREKLLDLMGVTNLIPGPNSTELAIHIGYERGGWRGLLVAGSCFILPAMLTVWFLAFLYHRYQQVPQLDWLLYGIKPVIIAVILQALWKLGGKALKSSLTKIAALGVIVAAFLGINEIALLLVAGLLVMLLKNWRSSRPLGGWLFPVMGIGTVNMGNNSAVTAHWSQIFLFFLKIGSVLYGSGYVLLAFLQRDLVERYQWLTSQQLLDAIAIGQFTPGPVFTTATFIGYLLGGNLGAIAATVGIFLPAFVLVLIINPWVNYLQKSPWFRGFLDGVNAASFGLMAVVTITLAQTALQDVLTLILMLASGVAVFRWQINTALLVLIGGIIGFCAQFWGN